MPFNESNFVESEGFWILKIAIPAFLLVLLASSIFTYIEESKARREIAELNAYGVKTKGWLDEKYRTKNGVHIITERHRICCVK